jgi:hypothetical protein
MSPFVCLLLGIFRFGDPSGDVAWKNQPATALRQNRPPSRWDKAVFDPALAAGVWHAGPVEIDFHPPGRHFVEVFLAVPEPVTDSFVLEAGGVAIDIRHRATGEPERLRDKASSRLISLLGWVEGGAQLQVATASRRYQVLAVRWTAEAEFDTRAIPRWLARARYLHGHALFEGQEDGPKARAQYLEQLHERLQFARDAKVRQEALVGLARAVYWQAAEDHEPRDEARLAVLLRRCLPFRDHPLVRQMITAACASTNTPNRPMLTGDLCHAVQPVRWSVDGAAPPPGAPEWAVTQRQLKRRMEAITRWWVEERQRENGELGGAWDDDVEILRQWGPLALGLGSPLAARGIGQLARGVWYSGQILHGYNARIRDVEHSAEPTTDTQPLLAALDPGDQDVLSRLREIAACAGNWIALQPDGQYRFRGAWFNCREFDPSPARAVDVHLNTRAIGPVLWHAYLTRDPRTIELLTRWAGAWVRAMRSTAAGKPAGRFPPAVWARDGSYPVNSARWDLPNAEWDYFQWSGRSQEALTSLVLAIYDLTGDAQWLEAARESFADPDPRFLQSPEAFHRWRDLSGDTRFDSFFGWKAEPGISGMVARMTAQAREMETRLGDNFAMYTSEPLYTDRVYYSLPAEYRLRLFGGEAPRGDRYPTFAVTWLPEAADFARAVLEATDRSLRIALYNFEERPVTARLRAWRLRPGGYRWRSEAGGGGFTVSARPHTVELPLPPRQAIEIEIASAESRSSVK